MKKLFNEYVSGAWFNDRYTWYREIVNDGLPNWVLYSGSIMWRGNHFVYFKIVKNSYNFVVETCINEDMGMIIEGCTGWYLVLLCRSCGVGGAEVRVRGCARRCRAFLERVVRAIASRTGEVPRPCKFEPLRIKVLRRMARYRACDHSGLFFHF